MEAQDDYVALHSDGKQLPEAAAHRQRWKRLLDPARFVRIHRSAIVNLERVARIEPYGKESRIAILDRRHAAAREPLRLRAAAGGDGGFAGEPQRHAVDARARSGLEAWPARR